MHLLIFFPRNSRYSNILMWRKVSIYKYSNKWWKCHPFFLTSFPFWTPALRQRSHTVTKGFFWHCRRLKGIFLSLSRIQSTRGAIQAVMECLTETAICSQLASRDLFGQWAQPSPRQTPAFLGRGAGSTAGPCRGSRSPSAPDSRTNTPLCPAHNSTGFTRKKKIKKKLSPSAQC